MQYFLYIRTIRSQPDQTAPGLNCCSRVNVLDPYPSQSSRIGPIGPEEEGKKMAVLKLSWLQA